MAAGVSRLIARAISCIPAPTAATGATVHLALSGGVDSSVAAFLLRERGWSVRPVVMKCWDDGSDVDDKAEGPCFEKELRAAQDAAHALSLDRQVDVYDFVKEYWNDVFEPVFLRGFAAGETPNPDMACNRSVKFGAFPARLRKERLKCADNNISRTPPFATGHYARIGVRADAQPQLLRATDTAKDQTYFLASVPGTELQTAMFPVGNLRKSEVREIALSVNLPAAAARSSRGICFVGKQRMGPFLERYLVSDTKRDARGHFIDNATGKALGILPGPAHTFTTGQRARLGGQPAALFVVGKRDADVFVSCSPASTREMRCSQLANWVAGTAPRELEAGLEMSLEFKSSSAATSEPCTARMEPDGAYLLRFYQPVNRVAVGQAVVLYQGDVCLGALWPEW